ncbi:MAG: hypothetical protein IBX64_06515 [Actinobacteria bacterium]|nr:hypothetical protein [Actinomycetota bacterium]
MSTSRIIIVTVAIILLGTAYYVFYVLSKVAPTRTANKTLDRQETSDQRGHFVETGKFIDHFKISLFLSSNRVRLGDKLSLKVSVENVSSESRELSFRSGQKFDIWVKDKSGCEVWRWSYGRMFTQMLETVVIKPNEKISYTADWSMVDLNGELVSPGDYYILANITADGLKEERLRFDITVKP